MNFSGAQFVSNVLATQKGLIHREHTYPASKIVYVHAVVGKKWS